MHVASYNVEVLEPDMAKQEHLLFSFQSLDRTCQIERSDPSLSTRMNKVFLGNNNAAIAPLHIT